MNKLHLKLHAEKSSIFGIKKMRSARRIEDTLRSYRSPREEKRHDFQPLGVVGQQREEREPLFSVPSLILISRSQSALALKEMAP